MVETVARAMWDQRVKGRMEEWKHEELGPSLQAALRYEARAAIAALRVPTEEMLRAGVPPLCGRVLVEGKADLKGAVLSEWQAMIDEALRNGPESASAEAQDA